ncbi:MAG: rhodanese-like domain-containing protein, partial [Gammaproteobacteria bacterium]
MVKDLAEKLQNMKSKLLSLLLLSFLFLSCQGQTSPALKTVDVKTFADKLNSTSNPQLLDVRTPAEFSGEHIDNAVNVNWNGDDFVTKANAY